MSVDAMILRGQMDGVGGRVEDWVWFFCRQISHWKLKPWGRQGRKLMREAINKVAARVDDNRRELVGRQTTIVREFNEAAIDDLMVGWRTDGEIELWCDACKLCEACAVAAGRCGGKHLSKAAKS